MPTSSDYHLGAMCMLTCCYIHSRSHHVNPELMLGADRSGLNSQQMAAQYPVHILPEDTTPLSGPYPPWKIRLDPICWQFRPAFFLLTDKEQQLTSSENTEWTKRSE